jgi:7-cyano-7-deazaguanine synthase in queuosine biosynthesis
MRITCGPPTFAFDSLPADLKVVLYGREASTDRGSAGAAIVEELHRKKLAPHQRAWDFLSIALAVTAADLAGHRDRSSDGWTREFELTIAVAEPEFWATQVRTLQDLLAFLTTDRWHLSFVPGALYPEQPPKPIYPDHDCVVLFSGGLDSFTGALDLVAQGRSPYAVSQSVRGDAEKQRSLASLLGGGMSHLQLNHNTDVPDPENQPSQRARSIIFFTYGILIATTLRKHVDGAHIPLFVCENGFIALNPPLTGSRLGSLSTRTCHPVVLSLLQRILDAASLRVRLENPYAYQTKGEMLLGAVRQEVLQEHAHETTSCGRFKRFGYRHCGRCVPCLIRRSAFHRWGVRDRTTYVYADLSLDDPEHARSDDVRAAAMAVAEVADVGIDEWLGVTLSSPFIGQSAPQLREVAFRGLMEVGGFLRVFHIR